MRVECFPFWYVGLVQYITAMCPTLIKCAAPDGSSVSTLGPYIRAMGVFDVVGGRFGVTRFVGLGTYRLYYDRANKAT